MNKQTQTLHSVIAETLLKKEEWMATSDPFTNAMKYALKSLHENGSLVTSGEFSLSRPKQQRNKKAA